MTREHQILHGVAVTRGKREAVTLRRILAPAHHKQHMRHFILGYYIGSAITAAIRIGRIIQATIAAVRACAIIVIVATVKKNDFLVHGLRHRHGHLDAYFALLVQRRHDPVYFGLAFGRIDRRAAQIGDSVEEYTVGRRSRRRRFRFGRLTRWLQRRRRRLGSISVFGVVGRDRRRGGRRGGRSRQIAAFALRFTLLFWGRNWPWLFHRRLLSFSFFYFVSVF